MVSVIGWASSLVLLATLINQVWQQWKSGSSAGVSKWLFVGQTAASLGFCIYSYLVDDWVFVITNAALLVNNLFGMSLMLYRRRREAQAAAAPAMSEWAPVPDVANPPHAESVR